MHSLALIESVLNQGASIRLQNKVLEPQNDQYEGCCFELDNVTYRSRLAKLTPKKVGYFVAFWQKDESGTNQPFSASDSPDKTIITIIDGEHKGMFIFPHHILVKRGVLREVSPDGELVSKGKMALRVYPSWVKGLNKSAAKIQQWQLPYFMDLSRKNKINQ